MLRKSSILPLLICVVFAVPSFADTFLWSYNVPGIDASGTFLTAPLTGGTYSILEITGQRNGQIITGLGDLGGANNLLYPMFPYFDFFGLAYIAGGTEFNLYGTIETGPFGQNPLLIETYLVFDAPPHQVDTEVRTFSLTRIEAVPEPSSVVLICSGLVALAGRLRRQKESGSQKQSRGKGNSFARIEIPRRARNDKRVRTYDGVWVST